MRAIVWTKNKKKIARGCAVCEIVKACLLLGRVGFLALCGHDMSGWPVCTPFQAWPMMSSLTVLAHSQARILHTTILPRHTTTYYYLECTGKHTILPSYVILPAHSDVRPGFRCTNLNFYSHLRTWVNIRRTVCVIGKKYVISWAYTSHCK